ncbi:MAG: hypothetical protein JSR86_22285, partial [Proteobacteria bacterium]|nr:hypothetical protein [Pseudomonadota bacterium]
IASYERSHALFVQAFAEAGAPSDLLSATYAKLKRAKDGGDRESSFSAISKH